MLCFVSVNPLSILCLLQECSLCCLRGGALKLTTDGRWCHLVCALSLPDVSFRDIDAHGPIDMSKMSPKRAKLVSLLYKVSH